MVDIQGQHHQVEVLDVEFKGLHQGALCPRDSRLQFFNQEFIRCEVAMARKLRLFQSWF